jgi:hypothetical protein
MKGWTFYGQRLAGPQTEGPSPVQPCPSTPGPSVVSRMGLSTPAGLAASGDGRLPHIQGAREQAATPDAWPAPDGQPPAAQWQRDAQPGAQRRHEWSLGATAGTDQRPAASTARAHQRPTAARTLWPAAPIQSWLHPARTAIQPGLYPARAKRRAPTHQRAAG